MANDLKFGNNARILSLSSCGNFTNAWIFSFSIYLIIRGPNKLCNCSKFSKGILYVLHK